MKIKNEPATLTGLGVAVVTAIVSLLVAFGIHVTPDQGAAIIGVVSAVAALVGALLVRSKVTPTNKVAAQLDKAGKTVAGPTAMQTPGAEVDVLTKEA